MSLRRLHLFSLVTLAGFFGAYAAPARAEEPPVPPFDQSVFAAALSRDLATHYAVNDELAVDLLRPWTSPVADVPGKSQAVTVSVVEYPSTIASSMLLRVRYLQGAAVLREDTVALQVQVWRDVLVAKSPVERGAPVVIDSLSTRRVDALRERDALPAAVLGQDFVFTQAVPAGRALTWRDVVKRSLVRRGDLIEVSAVDGQLQITMKALAMQDGARGDTVRVRNLDSKREFTGQVVADGRVQVSF